MSRRITPPNPLLSSFRARRYAAKNTYAAGTSSNAAASLNDSCSDKQAEGSNPTDSGGFASSPFKLSAGMLANWGGKEGYSR